jgi:UDPglucose 6-dehydrogenase
MSTTSKVTDKLSALKLDTNNLQSPSAAEINSILSPTAASLKDVQRPFHIVQIGAGVVGGAYVKAYLAAGCKVSVIEMNKNILKEFKDLGVDTYHAGEDTESIKNISHVDFIMISINTPQVGEADINMTYLMSSIPNVINIVKLSPTTMVIIRSTIKPTISQQYKEAVELGTGFNVDLLFQPEFLRAVSAEADALHPWHVVLGTNKDLPTEKQQKLMDLYTKFVDDKNTDITKNADITGLNVEEAELLKIAHNCFNAMKISFFNQFFLLVEKINKEHGYDINMDKISATMVKTCEGLLNPKYGTKAGHGYYGTCLPKDSAALKGLEAKYNLEASLFGQCVHVNKVIMRSDTKEHLDGDHHMEFSKFKVNIIKPNKALASSAAASGVQKFSETPKHDAAHKLHDQITSQ